MILREEAEDNKTHIMKGNCSFYPEASGAPYLYLVLSGSAETWQPQPRMRALLCTLAPGEQSQQSARLGAHPNSRLETKGGTNHLSVYE